MSRRLYPLVVCTLALSGAALSLHAQNSIDSLQHIQELTVYGRQQSEVIPPQKLSGEALERLNCLSVADAIRFFSGVQLKDYGGVGGLKTVNVRSLGANHVGVFYDGIQLGNAQNGQIDLGKFSLDNMEEIALYNGQKSDIFQPAKDFGNSGAVYLRSRRPAFDGTEKFHLRATMKAGSFGLANPSLLWEQKISPRVSSLFNAEYTYATGRYKFRYRKTNADGSTAYDTTAIRQNGDIEALRIEGGFFGDAPKGKWNAKAYFYNS
ncbi:MAG: TonB-dependent receptor plug domain-containing protein, partial [Porphyromonadaceae bacterium]|nr:TonB-dependent receptor plug domain-containing protein [Porphyromonadaceae bacterium]